MVEGNHLTRKVLYGAEEFYKIVSYNSVCNDIKILKSLHTDFLIMDEVQRLKNWNTQISKAARHIESDYSVILSGTPLENKLEDLYSIMQFVDQFCLGPYYQFLDQTVVRSDTGKVVSYKNLNLSLIHILGKGIKYFSNIGVSEFLVEAAEVSVGDKLLITGPTTGALFMTLEEARVDLEPVQTVKKGQHFSMKSDKIRPSDKLYKLVSTEELKKFKGLDIEQKRG